jgi:hypothetical protein
MRHQVAAIEAPRDARRRRDRLTALGSGRSETNRRKEAAHQKVAEQEQHRAQ